MKKKASESADFLADFLSDPRLLNYLKDNNGVMSFIDEEYQNFIASSENEEIAGELLSGSFKRLLKKIRYEKIIRIVSQTVHSSIDLDEVTVNAVKVMSENIESAQNVCIFMVEDDDAVLQAYRGFHDELIQKLKRIPYPKGFTWKTIIEGKPIHCADIDKDTVIGPTGRKLGIKSYVSMPISHAGKAIGCININSRSKFAFDKEELDLLAIVALQIESAINNAKIADELKKSQETLKRYVAELTRKNRYEEITYSITKSIHQSLELEQVFKNAVEAMAKNITDAGHVLIYMVEEQDCESEKPPCAVLKASYGQQDDYLNRIREIPYPQGASWKTIMEGKPRYVSDTREDSSILPVGIEYGTRSYISVPLKLEDDAVGCLHMHSSELNAFTEYDMEMLVKVATQLELAINKARQAGGAEGVGRSPQKCPQ